VVGKLLEVIENPDRHSMAVVSAAKAILELASRDDAPDPAGTVTKVVVITKGDLQAELAARGSAARVLRADRGHFDAE
jgi:hypothetical protein